jgi:hypothetical protein
MGKPHYDEFTTEETKSHFEAALRSVRIATPLHNESVTPKQGRAQSKKKQQQNKKPA